MQVYPKLEALDSRAVLEDDGAYHRICIRIMCLITSMKRSIKIFKVDGLIWFACVGLITVILLRLGIYVVVGGLPRIWCGLVQLYQRMKTEE